MCSLRGGIFDGDFSSCEFYGLTGWPAKVPCDRYAIEGCEGRLPHAAHGGVRVVAFVRSRLLKTSHDVNHDYLHRDLNYELGYVMRLSGVLCVGEVPTA